jgi:DNA-binding MarR family transcriptional regulator
MLKVGFAVVFERFNKEVDFLGRVVSDKMSDMSDKASDIMTDINSREAVVIDYLKTNAFITNKKACELLSIATATARRLLQSMSEKGLVIAEGENKGRRYKL